MRLEGGAGEGYVLIGWAGGGMGAQHSTHIKPSVGSGLGVGERCGVTWITPPTIPSLPFPTLPPTATPACPFLQVRVQVTPGHVAAEVLIAAEMPTHFQGQGPTLSCPLSLPACLRGPPALFPHSLRPVSPRLPSPTLPPIPPAPSPVPQSRRCECK